MKQTRSSPLAAKASTAQSSNRLPATSAKHFGTSAVVGINRRPRPAPITITRMQLLAPSLSRNFNEHALPWREPGVLAFVRHQRAFGDRYKLKFRNRFAKLGRADDRPVKVF